MVTLQHGIRTRPISILCSPMFPHILSSMLQLTRSGSAGSVKNPPSDMTWVIGLLIWFWAILSSGACFWSWVKPKIHFFTVFNLFLQDWQNNCLLLMPTLTVRKAKISVIMTCNVDRLYTKGASISWNYFVERSIRISHLV